MSRPKVRECDVCALSNSPALVICDLCAVAHDARAKAEGAAEEWAACVKIAEDLGSRGWHPDEIAAAIQARGVKP